MQIIQIAIFCFIAIMHFPFKSFSQLSEKREQLFQKANLSYGPDRKKTNPVDLAPTITRIAGDFSYEKIKEDSLENELFKYGFDQETNSISTSSGLTLFNRQVFGIGIVVDSKEEKSLDTFTLLSRSQELLSLGVETEDTEINEFLIHSLDLMNNNDPNKVIIVNSTLEHISSEGFSSTSLNFKREVKDTESEKNDFNYKILGEVASTSVEDAFLNTRTNLLFTFNFNPCLLETGIVKAVRIILNTKREDQISGHISAQCMIGKNAEGKFFSSYYLVDKLEGTIDRIDLKTELSLKVAEALYLRYTYIENGDNEALIDSYRQQTEIDELSVEYSLQTPNSVNNSLQSENSSLSQGVFHGLTLEKKTDDSEVCIQVRSLTTGTLKATNEETRIEESKPLFLFRYEDSCDPNRNEDEEEVDPTDFGDPDDIDFEENETSQRHFSLGNFHTVDNNYAKLLNYYNLLENPEQSLLNSFTLGKVYPESSNEYEIYSFKTTTKNTIKTGGVNELSFGVIHKQSETSVSLEQVILIPLNNFSNRLALQRPKISDEDRKKALKDPEVTEELINQRLSYSYENYDLGLCNRLDCFKMGASITFSNTGGVFLTAEGKTITDILGQEVEVSLLFGTPLNINSSFFNSKNQSSSLSPYISFAASSNNCDKLKELCADFSAKKDSESTTFGFYLENHF